MIVRGVLVRVMRPPARLSRALGVTVSELVK